MSEQIHTLPEETVIDLLQREIFSWVDYINHQPEDVRQDYEDFCVLNGCRVCNRSAKAFLEEKEKDFEEGLAAGNI